MRQLAFPHGNGSWREGAGDGRGGGTCFGRGEVREERGGKEEGHIFADGRKEEDGNIGSGGVSEKMGGEKEGNILAEVKRGRRGEGRRRRIIYRRERRRVIYRQRRERRRVIYR